MFLDKHDHRTFRPAVLAGLVIYSNFDMLVLAHIRILLLRLIIQVKKVYYRIKAYKVYQQIKQLKKEVKVLNRKDQQAEKK